jgi:hypothetical protein
MNKSKIVTFIIITSILSMLTGCLSMEEARAIVAEKNQKEKALEEAKALADTVRLISPEQAKECTYVTQVSALSKLAFFGGMEKTEEFAMEKVKIKAIQNDANALRIAERLFDKGRGGADSTSLTLYADIYNCDF